MVVLAYPENQSRQRDRNDAEISIPSSSSPQLLAIYPARICEEFGLKVKEGGYGQRSRKAKIRKDLKMRFYIGYVTDRFGKIL